MKYLLIPVLSIITYIHTYAASEKFAPDFLIIGVTKCGTTSLYDYLVQHPKILGANEKELKFFNKSKYKKGMLYYQSCFPQKKSRDQLVGEATPGYFWHNRCSEKIKAHCPSTKLILILRNPAIRAISHYHFCEDVKRRHELKDQPFFDTFEAAINNRMARNGIIGAGCYITHLERWLKLFPQKQIHIVILEDLMVDPENEVNRVFNFLGLDSFKLNEYALSCKGKYKHGTIKQTTIDWLHDFYKPYNAKLERFLKRQLPWR